ncbi:hypothetical protein [Leifsonia sp. NPDC080035]|uniref:FtsX-like permease family protein n=1 Tax=Leifsonia sp. NPDC080035 TaxID=3143936 RepID=A0AAU7G9F3_9MICO
MRAKPDRGAAVRPFWLLRSRAQAGTLAATGLVVVVVAFLASVMAGLALRSPDAAVRATLAEEPAAVTSLALQATASSDAEAQDAAVRSVIGSRFRGAPMDVDAVSFVPSAAVSGGGSALLLVSDRALEDRVRFVSGRAPGAGEAAVDAAFARAHTLKAGDALTFRAASGPVRVTVSGVWRPRDAAAPAWLGVTSGIGATDGRVIADRRVADAAGDGITAQWTLAPDAGRLTAAQLPRLHQGLTTVRDALSEDAVAGSSPFSATGGAAATATAMQRSVLALQAVIPVPLAVLAVCSVIALVLLVQLLAAARRVETRLLRSRGVTVPALALATAAESGVVAIAAVVVGSGVAQAVLSLLVGPPSGVLDVLLPPLLVLAAAVGTATLTVAVSARSITDAPGAVEAGRGRTVVSGGLTVLAVIAAGVTLWRFVAFGPAAGGTAVDPAGVVAPAAVLCAIALLGLLLFGPASAAVERVAGRGRGVAGVLPARQVGRGVALFAGPVALIVLAVGAITFAAGYAGTFGGFLRDSALLVNGAAVRVDLGVGGSPRGAEDVSGAESLSHASGVTASSPAIVDDGTVGDTDVTVVAADAARLPALVPVGGYLLDTQRLASRVAVKDALAGPRVTGTVNATVALTASAGAAEVTGATLWFANTAGEVVPVSAAPSAAGAVGIRVPSGGSWRLVAADVAVASVTDGAANVEVRVAGLPSAAASWALAPAAFGSAGTFRAVAPLGATAAYLDGNASVRFLPKASAAAVPVAITGALAADDALELGQRIELSGPIGSLSAVVSDIVPALPGTSSERAVFADLPALGEQLLHTTPSVTRASAVLLTGDDTDAIAGAARASAGPDAVVSTASGAFVSRFLSGAVISTWLGAAGCALLAVAAITAAIAAALRRRRGEVIVLRAVGLSGRQQAGARRLEVVGVSVAAGVFGLLGGVVVVLLVGNTLARLSVVTAPATLSVRGTVDPVGMAVGLVALGAAVAVAVWGYGSAVRRQAADTAYREETR